MPMMAGDQNRQRDQDECGNQTTSPPFVFVLRRSLEAFDASFESAQRLVIRIRGILGFFRHYFLLLAEY